MIFLLESNTQAVTMFCLLFSKNFFLGNNPLKFPTTSVEYGALSPSTICNISGIKQYLLFPLSQLTIWKLTLKLEQTLTSILIKFTHIVTI